MGYNIYIYTILYITIIYSNIIYYKPLPTTINHSEFPGPFFRRKIQVTCDGMLPKMTRRLGEHHVATAVNLWMIYGKILGYEWDFNGIWNWEMFNSSTRKMMGKTGGFHDGLMDSWWIMEV